MRGNLRTSSNLKSTLRAYLVPFLGLVFSAAAFFGIKADLFKGLTSEANIALIFIGLFATYFFVAHVATRSKWEKFYGYAQLFSSLNKGFEEVHHLQVKRGYYIFLKNLSIHFQAIASFTELHPVEIKGSIWYK